MSSRRKSADLGRALVKERKRERKAGGRGDGWLHTSELSDGYEWGRLNLTSVTEENSLDEFLRTAELAGTEFTAEKRNICVVHDSERYTGLPGADERKEIEEAQKLCIQDLCIPRRPSWDQSTTAEELELREREAFLDWRRHLASLEEREKIILTPFERNLEFWRQLWRVIERSDVVVQIVDARNPLLFHCKDLEKYVKEVNPEKVNMLLMSKSDLLTPEQRATWLKHFQSHFEFEAVGFWSAKIESLLEESETSHEEVTGEGSSTSYEGDPGARGSATSNGIGSDIVAAGSFGDSSNVDLLSCEDLLQMFRKIAPVTNHPATIGLVGYPNVGKSSTINTLLQMKKVPVSATPGRTKHFQTLHVNDDIVLCDCPGLVFPNFVSTKADMVCNGILPIDRMRDHIPPVSMVCERVPRPVLERTYGIRIPFPMEGEDPLRPLLSNELLCAYGYSRGFMTSHGQPDQSRSARYILKDYVNGKLLYCVPPPLVDPIEFNKSLYKELEVTEKESNGVRQSPPVKKSDTPKFDNAFFEQRRGIVHSKGATAVPTGRSETSTDKPGKKHHNYKKKEKTRRIIGDHNPYNYY